MEPETIEQLAGILYERYCQEVGGVAFNGDTLIWLRTIKGETVLARRIADTQLFKKMLPNVNLNRNGFKANPAHYWIIAEAPEFNP